jgi:hypothetical protein
MRRISQSIIPIISTVTATLLLSLFCYQAGFCGDSSAITGKVLDSAGKSIADATVMVYHAGPTSGYSLFCPSCYADCGKRAITDTKGTFSFDHLSPGLWFDLLVAADGYAPVLVKKVDPRSQNVPVTAVLTRRPPVADPMRTFRGLVEDSQGLPLHDAVIQPVGVLLDSKTGSSTYGTIAGLDALAVTNDRGKFEIAYSSPGPNAVIFGGRPGDIPQQILVSIDARGMSEKFGTLSAGLEPRTIQVGEGAIVRGRLVQDGKPVADAEVGLIGRPRGGFGGNLEVSGYPYDEIRIGTNADGRFTLTNVPAPADWYVYGKMDSLATRGSTGVVACATQHDGEIVDVGDLVLKPAYRLRGRVVLSDGKPIPDGMRVTIHSKLAWDSQTAMLPPDGRFEFLGLAAGDYSVFASVKGYYLAKTPISVKEKDGSVTQYAPGVAPPFSIDHDVNDFVITLQPKAKVTNSSDSKAPQL